MTRKTTKRVSSDECIEQNFANYLKRKSLLHQKMLLQQQCPQQQQPHFWTLIYNQIWNLVTKTFKKETRFNESDLFNEACAARLAAQRNSNRIRSRRELDFLCKKTKLSKNEIKILYWGWKCVCPNGFLTESICKEIYAQFFPQASDSSLYAKHVYRALFCKNNYLVNNLNNNSLLTANANNLSSTNIESERNCQKSQTTNKSKNLKKNEFINNENDLINENKDSFENKTRLRSSSTIAFKNNNISSNSTTVSSLTKRRALSLAKQTLDHSTPSYVKNFEKNNATLSAIQDDLDYSLRRSSKNTSSVNLSHCRDNVPDRITFVEYAISLSLLMKGTLEEKLAWTFQLYDVNMDGKITLDELIEISKAIYALLGYYVAPAHDTNTYIEHGKMIFEKLDINNNGYVTLEQFLNCCLKDENIIKSLQLIMVDLF